MHIDYQKIGLDTYSFKFKMFRKKKLASIEIQTGNMYFLFEI